MMKDVTGLVSIDNEMLRREIDRLDVLDFLYANNRQMAVQHRNIIDTDRQLIESCQSLVYDWDRFDQTVDEEPPRRDEILDERTFTETCEYFKGSYIAELVSQLKDVFGVFRGRFMLMKYKTCLSMHVDDTPRLHIPIYTNGDSFMVVNDIVYRLEYGKCYIVDTRLPHTAVNAGKKDRLHLVFCVNQF